LLTRDELVAIVDQYELEPQNRKSKDALLEAVAGSRKATASEFLSELPRDRLKALCQGLGVD